MKFTDTQAQMLSQIEDLSRICVQKTISTYLSEIKFYCKENKIKFDSAAIAAIMPAILDTQKDVYKLMIASLTASEENPTQGTLNVSN